MDFLRLLKNSFGLTPKKKTGAFFRASDYEMKNLLCGVGQSKILETTIHISNYPFEPSIAFPEKIIEAEHISAISLDFGPYKLFVEDDIVFVSAKYKDELTKFAKSNAIKLVPHSNNWEWILQPYVDTEFTEENRQWCYQKLNEKGFNNAEIELLRNEVAEQMYKYNFDTMLWDWCSLGLSDVLSAMRVKYNKNEFREFYYKAIAIYKRNN